MKRQAAGVVRRMANYPRGLFSIVLEEPSAKDNH